MVIPFLLRPALTLSCRFGLALAGEMRSDFFLSVMTERAALEFRELAVAHCGDENEG